MDRRGPLSGMVAHFGGARGLEGLDRLLSGSCFIGRSGVVGLVLRVALGMQSGVFIWPFRGSAIYFGHGGLVMKVSVGSGVLLYTMTLFGSIWEGTLVFGAVMTPGGTGCRSIFRTGSLGAQGTQIRF